jgi:diaminopimelate decarboxylase
MDHFHYQDGQLHGEKVALSAIAEAIGTPFYCYSRATLERHYKVFNESLAAADHQICYAVKANSNLSVLKTLALMGSGADVVSEGEIRRALAAGISPKKIVFSGVGKTQDEMAFALDVGIWQFNVESEPELLALNDVATTLGIKAPIALRINPDVDAQTHAKISTGKAENKFGVSMLEAKALYGRAAQMSGIEVQGVSMHIGSQLTSLAPFREAYSRARTFVEALRADGHTISVLDVGGGLGIPYEQSGEIPPAPADYGAMVVEILGDIGCKLVFEPGRLLVGNAGILVSCVIYVKETLTKKFLIVDAAMNDLRRPAMYDARHELVTVAESDAALRHYDIVGPVCETGDTFEQNAKLPPMQAGDLVAFRSAGAYGSTMSGTYNTRPLVAEVMVDGDTYAVIRPRQSYEALIGQDVVAGFL